MRPADRFLDCFELTPEAYARASSGAINICMTGLVTTLMPGRVRNAAWRRRRLKRKMNSVEVGLDVLAAEAVINAESPGFQVGEHAVDPGQHDVGGHRADDVRIVGIPLRAGIARPAVGLRRGAGGDGGAQEVVQTVGGLAY